MQTRDLTISGGIVYWSLAKHTSLDALREGWTALGLESFVPHPPTPEAALRAALLEHFGGRGLLVRPLQKAGYAVVRETDVNQGEGLEYTTELRAFLNEQETLHLTPFYHLSVATIQEAYLRHRALLPATTVGIALTRVLLAEHAVCLRSTGGVYWLPETAMPTFTAAAVSAEQAARQGKSAVYVVRTAMDEATARAVIDALTHQVETELTWLRQEIEGTELGPVALEGRSRQAGALADKVRVYEGFLGVALDHLRTDAEAVEALAAATALAGMAGENTASAVA